MPLSGEFLHHLHELMIETSDKLRDELNNYKRERIWKAQQTHNAAAIPGAYSDASIHAFRTRTSATIASYLGALETFGIEVDNSVEQEMLTIVGRLTNVRSSLSLPPGVKPPNISAIQTAHKLEMSRIGNSLYRDAANRLREIKVKSRRVQSAAHETTLVPHSEPFTIASVAKTLAELKALPPLDQAKLLLKRLVHIEPQVRSSGGFNQHNLLLQNDPWGLAAGFALSENEAVRIHLLGSPWTRLVNDGFLLDPRGSGFFLISEEGHATDKDVSTQKNETRGESDKLPTVRQNDPLVPLFNRYEFDRDLAKLTSTSSATSPGTLIMIDLDNFKEINDSNESHIVGDKALRSVAEVLLCVTQQKGIAYRIGGDEFCVLLPNHTTDEGAAVAERIRREVQAVRIADIPDGLTTSVGVSCFPECVAEPNDLFKTADAAMYKSKNEGRNRVSRAQPMSVPSQKDLKKVKNRKSENVTVRDWTTEWTEQEARFRKLEVSRVFGEFSVDNSGAEVCAIRTDGAPQDLAECKTACAFAGGRLSASPGIELSETVRSEPEHWKRWLLFLRETQGLDRKFENGTGYIQNLASVSARACLDCAARTFGT
jgi:diguanylate cyclase (GGDEF)-like protein